MPGTHFARSLAAVALIVVALLPLSNPTSLADSPRLVKLTILHTNDLHGHLFPFNYDGAGGVENDVGGAARRATLIRRIKQTTGHPVLVMDAGDAFTRGPIADLLGVPDFEVMNATPYDIMTIGNNEFKGASGMAGQANLRERFKQAGFPIVSANIREKTTGKTMVAPWKVFDVDGVRVGVFGLTAPRVADYPQAEGLEIADPISTARSVLPRLLDECDFVVALTHIGYPMDLQLAAAVPGVDVIIGGDSHTWVFEPSLVKNGEKGPDWWAGGTIVCQDGEWGKCLGRLDLVIRASGEHRWRVASYSGELVPVDSSTPPAEDVERILARHSKPYMREIGTLAKAVPVDRAAAWVAEVIRKAARAQVAVVPNYTVENGLNAGRVTELDVRKMFPFGNRVARLNITGKNLIAFIKEMDCSLAGVEARGDSYYVGDRPVEPGAFYTLAVEDYFANTSPSLRGAPCRSLGTTKEIVIEHIRAGRALGGADEG